MPARTHALRKVTCQCPESSPRAWRWLLLVSQCTVIEESTHALGGMAEIQLSRAPSVLSQRQQTPSLVQTHASASPVLCAQHVLPRVMQEALAVCTRKSSKDSLPSVRESVSAFCAAASCSSSCCFRNAASSGFAKLKQDALRRTITLVLVRRMITVRLRHRHGFCTQRSPCPGALSVFGCNGSRAPTYRHVPVPVPVLLC